MIKSIFVIVNNHRTNYLFDKNNVLKTIIDCKNNINNENSFDIEITFNSDIKKFRNHDYKWISVNNNLVANEYCPKILQLENGRLVQANITSGIWETRNKNILLWRFNPENAHGYTQYIGKNSIKNIQDSNNELKFVSTPSLLFPKSAIEISRSPIPFSAIICFTDHCDFDTAQNLKLQLDFFNEHAIKITKGFFLNHFSKRADNASYENESEILDLWRNSGHELCYHSLSQSIKSSDESLNDFLNFEPPFSDVNVWIDHGFQPYNFSFYKKFGIDDKLFEDKLINKNINVLWNYIDSGTATNGIINQLNPEQFTLNNFWKGTKSFSLKTRIIMLFKNIIFHFDNNKTRVRNYIDALSAAKNMISKKSIKPILGFIKNIIPVIGIILKTIFGWQFYKNQPYKMAKNQSILFKHKIFNHSFYIFQTLELIDFKKGLHSENIELLIQQSGVTVAHTYFSANAKHYSGKMFSQENTIDVEVAENFKYLSKKIKEKKIWNPTLSEFINYWSKFDDFILDIDENGNLIIQQNFGLLTRIIA